jgi:hypothetical protein
LRTSARATTWAWYARFLAMLAASVDIIAHSRASLLWPLMMWYYYSLQGARRVKMNFV